MKLSRFTTMVSSGGCAAKVDLATLDELLLALGEDDAPEELLVGLGDRDDAAIWKLDDARALVLTVDFSPPVVADAYQAGSLAAVNALNDIYAKGGQPALCLNILGVPHQIDPLWIKAMLEGAAERVRAASALIVGGHTVLCPEPLYGLAVVGFVSPGGTWRLSGARPGDVLIMTKPLGCGVLFTAARHDSSVASLLEESLPQMVLLHRTAVKALSAIDVHAATDISGFGLAGHLIEIARASNVTISLIAERIKVYPGVWELLNAGWTTRITDKNWISTADDVNISVDVSPLQKAVLFDPQTAGGILIVVDPRDADVALSLLREAQLPDAMIVGTVVGENLGNRPALTVRASL